MKTKMLKIMAIIFAVCGVFMAGCGAELLPETTCSELGIYLFNDTVVDTDGIEIIKDGNPVYHLSKDGHIAVYDEKGKELVVVAADNVELFTCAEEAVIDEKYKAVEIPMLVIENDGVIAEIYEPVVWDIPVTIPDSGINRTITVETADVNTLYFNDGDEAVTFDGTEPTVLKATACYPGITEITVRNVLGDIILTADINISAKQVENEAETEKVKDETAKCVHDYESTVVNSTEKAQGYTLHTCKLCGHKYRDSYTPKLSCRHDYSERIVLATCKEAGYTLCTCKKCGAVEKKDITPVGDHNYKDEIVVPNCTERGYTKHTCTVCGKVVKDTYTDKTAHSYTVQTVLSTCSAQGYTKNTCTVCGFTEIVNYRPLTAHNYGAELRVEPTFNSDGYTYRRCTTCGKADKTGVLPRIVCTAHSYAETGRTEPTCTATGSISKRCTVCGATNSETIPAKGHSYKDTVIQPTCETDGYTTHICTVCGTSYTDTHIPALGHEWDGGASQQVQTGIRPAVVCTACGCESPDAAHQEAHMAAGEDSGYKQVAVPVYETVTVYTCIRCGVTR